LALLGAYNVMQKYPIDPERIYIGGFSGGSRVALKTALAYPDLFRGALLNAGSDPIGDGEDFVPPGDLFARFQSSRLVYVTGSEDEWNLQRDMVSRDSMKAWCVFGTAIQTMYRVGHESAAPHAVDLAITALDQRPLADQGTLSACRARLAKESAADLQRIAELLERDRPHDAWRSLTKADSRYGGLAATEIEQLEQRIGARR
jgi:pimeloyl-ACP methyl ester carboxylesterase